MSSISVCNLPRYCFVTLVPTLDLDPLRATVDQPGPWRRPSARSPSLDSNRKCLALPISTTRRTLRSPAKGEGRRADVVGGSLTVKLLGGQRDADVYSHRFRRYHREARLHVA